ncbi:MAG: ECF-type sigma factor [Bryobacteraceae bacterium]|nr:ECF-type sigma factor [Bryobacteraceae bacterium]
MPVNRVEITALLRMAGEGNREAEARLVSAVYPQLQVIARRLMRSERPDHTLQPTALVNEAYVKIFAGEPVVMNDRAHFMAVAARQMRRVLVSHSRQHRAAKRGCGLKVVLEEGILASEERTQDIELVEQLIGRLQQIEPAAAHVTELKFFGGMTDEEVALALGTNHTRVRRDWSFARAWMRKQLGVAPSSEVAAARS